MKTCRACLTANDSRKKRCGACGRKLPVKRRPKHLAALTLPYEAFVEANGGVDACGICGAQGKTRRLHRDHDHATGLPRGVLCFRDNAALRSYMTVEWLRAALAYMERAA